MNVKDYLGLTPVYLLCSKGYKKGKKGEEIREHKRRHKLLKFLCDIQDSEAKRRGESDYIYQPAPRVKFTPFHWLCYWDDIDSIKFLLRDVQSDAG